MCVVDIKSKIPIKMYTRKMFRNYRIQRWFMCTKSIQLQSILFWCICSILIIHTDSHQRDFGGGDLTTARGVFYTVGLKLNHSNRMRQHSSGKSSSSSSSSNSDDQPPINRHGVNQLKNQIKYVLNLQTVNDTIDKYIVETFNIHNPDPMYVFVLPNALNQTIILRRSNFSDISFPNTTKIQKLQNLLKSSKFAHLFPSHDELTAKQLALDQRFFTKYQQFMSSENDLREAESIRIIEENVRTEKNFFKFMNKLNEDDIDHHGVSIEDSDEHHRPKINHQHRHHHESTDYPSLIRNIHTKAKTNIGGYALAKDYIHKPPIVSWSSTTQKPISWADFGLHGWVGKINEHHENPEENGNQMRIEAPDIALREENLFPHKFLPILVNYDPLALLTSTSTSTSTTTTKPHFHPSSQSSDWPQPVHQFSFVDHENHSPSKPTRSRPKPPSIILSSMYQSTKPTITTTTTTTTTTHRPSSQYNSHRKPFKLNSSDIGWDVKFNVSDELRELLRLEKIKLENISQAIGTNSKWIVTSSRAKHRDADVFVARANNPFGHSTKWKLSVASPNDVSMDASGNDEDDRQKRDVIDLYSMVKCATGCDPLIFKGYGCYCGFLGSGKALDGIDRCCKMHDYCYHAANCPKFLEYFVPYLWKCWHGRPLCAISNGEWGGPGSCSATLCECDRALSNCLRRFYCPRKRAVCTSSPLRLLQNLLMDI